MLISFVQRKLYVNLVAQGCCNLVFVVKDVCQVSETPASVFTDRELKDAP